MALRQTRVPARPHRGRRINRGHPLQRPFLVLPTFSPSSPSLGPSLLISFAPPQPPLSCSSPTSIARLAPQPHVVARLAKRYWFYSSSSRVLGRDVPAFIHGAFRPLHLLTRLQQPRLSSTSSFHSVRSRSNTRLDFLLSGVSPRPSPIALPARIPRFARRIGTYGYQVGGHPFTPAIRKAFIS